MLVHTLLEGLDFRRGAAPSASAAMAAAARAGMRPNDDELDEAVAMVQRFLDTELCRRLAAVPELRREEPFSFVLDPGGIVVDGFIDVLARERERTIVVDYKSDRLAGADPAAVAQREYAIQRLVYALAALKGGAEVVEVVHAFLEQPDRPVIAAYTTADADALERDAHGPGGRGPAQGLHGERFSPAVAVPRLSRRGRPVLVAARADAARAARHAVLRRRSAGR